MLCMPTTKFRCLQDILPSNPMDQGEEGEWETVGEPAERSRSPAPAITEAVPQAPVAEGRTEPAVDTAEEPAATEAKEEAPAEAGLVDIASILGAPEGPIRRTRGGGVNGSR
jgi:hypothetical protein